MYSYIVIDWNGNQAEINADSEEIAERTYEEIYDETVVEVRLYGDV
jgi:hypothetical protein